MTFINRRLTEEQRKAYKQLELIPEAVCMRSNVPLWGFGLVPAWKKLLSLLLDELVAEQRVEYLERCFALDEFGHGKQSPDSSLQRFLVLIE